MTHEEIQSKEIAESYLQGRLSEPERAAFEDHCYACDECFEHLKLLDRFVDTVHHAAQRGMFPAAPEVSAPRWLQPAFLAACAASVVLAAVGGWAMLVERPRLSQVAASERAQADAVRKRLAQVEQDLAGRQIASAHVMSPEANLPLVMLEASRADGARVIALPSGASQLAIWLEPPPAPATSKYRLEISREGDTTIETIDGLVRNSYGALAASVPASRFKAGTYRARLFSATGEKSSLVGEYRFAIQK